jgi:uncharacterized membrane protein
MGYVILVLGVGLWSVAHLFKRLAPERRAAMGDPAKGLVTTALLISIVLMIVGYRWAEPVWLWYPPPFLRHINNLLVLLGFYLFAASGLQTAITRRIRHPQLSGFKAWAVAHLLVVGHLSGIVLFGGLLAWAVVAVILINRAERRWTPPASSTAGKEVAAVAIALVATAVVGWIHAWLGAWPFG